MATSETSKPIPQKTVTDHKSAGKSGTGFADTAGTDHGNTTPLRVRDHVGGSPSKASRVGVVANQSIVPNHDRIDRSYFGSIWRQFVK
jgi:hypothetical protein